MSLGWIQPTAPAALGASHGPSDADADLLARWREGDDSAFEGLVRRHQRRVFRLALRMLGDREEAEDVAQEAFLNLHRHGRRFRGEARFSTFVYRVSANAALNRRRALARARGRLRALALGGAGGAERPAPRSPEDASARAQLQVRVQSALLSLPDRERAAVCLVDLEGLSYREVADVLGLPEGTVKSRVHRARMALRDRLRDLVAEPGP